MRRVEPPSAATPRDMNDDIANGGDLLPGHGDTGGQSAMKLSGLAGYLLHEALTAADPTGNRAFRLAFRADSFQLDLDLQSATDRIATLNGRVIFLIERAVDRQLEGSCLDATMYDDAPVLVLTKEGDGEQAHQVTLNVAGT